MTLRMPGLLEISHQTQDIVIPGHLWVSGMNQLIIHRKSESSSTMLVHHGHKLLLIVALHMRGLAFRTLIRKRVNAWSADNQHPRWLQLASHARKEPMPLLDRHMFDDVQGKDHIVRM